MSENFLKILLMFIGISLFIAYIIYLIFYKNIKANNVYSVIFLILITTMILFNLLKFFKEKQVKYIYSIFLNLLISIFGILYFTNYELIETCMSETEKSSFITHFVILLSIYFYLYKDKKLADCSYKSFSKILIFLSIILSIIHKSNSMLIFSLFLFFYMFF